MLEYNEIVPAVLEEMNFIENMVILQCVGSYKDGSLEFHLIDE